MPDTDETIDAYNYVQIVPEGPPDPIMVPIGEYQGLQNRDPPTQYREPEAKVQSPLYDNPQPAYTAVRHKGQPRIEEPENEVGIYEEVDSTLNKQMPRSRPVSADLSGFTPDQLALLMDLMQRVGEGGQYSTPFPVSPRRKPVAPQNRATVLYDDTVIVKKPAYMEKRYENTDEDDIYDTIPDDFPVNEVARPKKPLPPPKPQKHTTKQCVLALPPLMPPPCPPNSEAISE